MCVSIPNSSKVASISPTAMYRGVIVISSSCEGRPQAQSHVECNVTAAAIAAGNFQAQP